MSAFTPEQWAAAGEHLYRAHAAANGLTPTAAGIDEAKDAAVHIACGYRISAATGRRECGGPEPDGGDNHRQPVTEFPCVAGPPHGETPCSGDGQFCMEHAP